MLDLGLEPLAFRPVTVSGPAGLLGSRKHQAPWEVTHRLLGAPNFALCYLLFRASVGIEVVGLETLSSVCPSTASVPGLHFLAVQWMAGSEEPDAQRTVHL